MIDREYCASPRNGLVWMNTSTWPACPFCLRSFSQAREANSVTDSTRSANSVIAVPKLRVHAISFFDAGQSSNAMHACPCSSRTVRSNVTDQRRRATTGSMRATSSAVFNPSWCNWAAVRLPIPQISLRSVNVFSITTIVQKIKQLNVSSKSTMLHSVRGRSTTSSHLINHLIYRCRREFRWDLADQSLQARRRARRRLHRRR